MTWDSTAPSSPDSGHLRGTIAGIRILSPLASGGMSHVYVGVDEATGQRVALKLVLRNFRKDAVEILNAEREGAKLQERLCASEPRVVRILKYGDEGDYFYVVMELVDGEDLSEVVARGRLDVREALRIAIEVCEVLKSAHSLDGQVDGRNFHSIVHGDIKPHNIRLTPQSSVKVLDFGIAKALSLSRRLTSNDFGSLPYSSPERLENGHVTEQSDLWSLGVVLYEMLSGRPPFYADTGEACEKLILARRSAPALIDCPPALMHIVSKTLAPSLERRYPDATALLDDLAAFRDGRPTQADAVMLDDSTQRVTPPRNHASRDDETQRTFKANANPQGPTPPPPQETSRAPVSSSRARPTKDDVRRIVRWSSLILILATLAWGASVVREQGRIAGRARSLADDLAASRADRQAAFDEYKQLSRRSLVSILVSPLARGLRASYLSVADSVIEAYRTSDAPLVREKDWRGAAAAVAHTLELDPRSRPLRARQALIQAHLIRIGLLGRRPDQGRVQEAIHRFREASELDDWGDPFLGLASLHAYVRHDVENTDAAIDQLPTHHLKLGKREQAQRADVRLLRATDMWRNRGSIARLPEEMQYIETIRDHVSKAIEMYGTILGFEGTHANLRDAHRLLDRVTSRLTELESIRNLQETPTPAVEQPPEGASDRTADATSSGGA